MVAALGEAAASEPRARSHSGILVLLWLLLLGGAGAACAPDRVLLLTVLDIPAEVTTLRVSALVEGKLLQEPVEVSAQEPTLRLPLDATAQGRVSVEVQALDAQSCVPMHGVAGAPLQAVGLTQVDVFLRPLSTKTCPLTVRGVEPKLLRVVSSGEELDCGSRCEVQVALGTRLTLTAQPLDGGHFVGWTEACQGTQPCELVMQGPTLVTATSAQAGICSRSGFCWENPRPVGEDLRALCAKVKERGAPATAQPNRGTRAFHATARHAHRGPLRARSPPGRGWHGGGLRRVRHAARAARRRRADFL